MTGRSSGHICRRPAFAMGPDDTNPDNVKNPMMCCQCSLQMLNIHMAALQYGSDNPV